MMEQQLQQLQRSLTMLDQTGDTTLIWDETSDEAVIPVIEKKLAEGLTFFMLEPVAGGLVAPKRIPLTDVAQVRERRALAMADKDFAALVGLGQITVVKTDDAGENAPTRRGRTKISKDPKEIASGQSVASRRPRGG
jgi:hypothetical protein